MSVVIVYMDEYYKFYKLINRNIMVIKKVFPLLGSLLFMFSSCMDDIDVIQKSTVLETKSSSFGLGKITSFSNCFKNAYFSCN